MKLIKQILFKIEASKTQYNSTFFVEANNFEEALVIAKEVLMDYQKGWNIKSITSHAPLFKSETKESLLHKTLLEKGVHHSVYLQRAFDKYGTSLFIMEVLLLCKLEYLLYYELLLIYELEPDYNMNKQATSNRGYKWSEQSRLKASESQLGNQNALGHKLSEESKLLISASRKGKYIGELNGFYGKTHTEEVKQRIRDAQTGRKHSEDTRKRLAKSHYKPVRIGDTIYESLNAASEASGINKTTLSRWCKDERKLNYAFV